MADHSVTVDATPPSAPAWWTPWCSDCRWQGRNWPWGQKLQADEEAAAHVGALDWQQDQRARTPGCTCGAGDLPAFDHSTHCIARAR